MSIFSFFSRFTRRRRTRRSASEYLEGLSASEKAEYLEAARTSEDGHGHACGLRDSGSASRSGKAQEDTSEHEL